MYVLFSPGLIVTNFGAAAGFSEQEYAVFKEQMITKIPVRRAGKPEDMAECILFLASDKASFVDGINLVADGGALEVA